MQQKRQLAGPWLAALALVAIGIIVAMGCSSKDEAQAQHGKIAQAVKIGDWCDCWYAGIDERLHDDGTGKVDGGWLFCVEDKTTPGSCSYEPDCMLTSWCSAADTPAWVAGSGKAPGFCVQKDGTMLTCNSSNEMGFVSSSDASTDATLDTSSGDTASSDTSVADTADSTVADTSDASSDALTDAADTTSSDTAVADTADAAADVVADSGVADTGSADAGADVADASDASSDAAGDVLTDADVLADAASDATFTPGLGCSDSPKTGWVAEYYPPSGYMPPGPVTFQGSFASGGIFWTNSDGTGGPPLCTMVKNGCGGFSCSGFAVPSATRWDFNLRYGDPALTVYGGGWVYDQCCWTSGPFTSGGAAMHGGCGADFGTLLVKKDNVVKNAGASFSKVDNGVDSYACTLNGVINPTP